MLQVSDALPAWWLHPDQGLPAHQQVEHGVCCHWHMHPPHTWFWGDIDTNTLPAASTRCPCLLPYSICQNGEPHLPHTSLLMSPAWGACTLIWCWFPASYPLRPPSTTTSSLQHSHLQGTTSEEAQEELPQHLRRRQAQGWVRQICWPAMVCTVAGWRLLILGIVSAVPCLSPLCLCVFFFATSSFTCSSLCTEEILDGIMSMK